MGDSKEDFKAANASAAASPTANAQPGSPLSPCPEPPVSKVLSAYFAIQKVTEDKKKKTKSISFSRINNGLFGSKIWIVVETKELQGKELSVEILGSKNTTFVAPDATITFMQDGADTSPLKATVGNYKDKKEFTNAASFADKAIIEIELKPKDKATATDWAKKIHESTERKAFLHLSITASGGFDTEYTCEDDTLQSPAKDKSIFLNKTASFFELMECCYGVTKSQLQTVFSGATDAKLDELVKVFNEAYDKFSVDSCLRKAHFFAQMRQEVGTSATNHEESLNYDAERLKRKVNDPTDASKKKGPFSYFWTHTDEADLYGRTATQAANQEAIGNRAYASRNGNGDIASGDGWKYRGKGYIQLTGKSNYQSVQNEITAKFPASGIDIIANEGDILTIKGAMISAMAFWSAHSLHLKADKGETDAVVDSITAVINKNTDSYAERRTHFNGNKTVFKTSDCPRKP